MTVAGLPAGRRRCLRAAVALLAAGGAQRALAQPDTGLPPTVRHRRFTTSDGVVLHYLDSTPPSLPAKRPTLVFVPGWTMPAAIFSRQLAHFGPTCRLIALDPRGQGESDIPATGYTAPRRAADIAELVEQIDRPILIGWSLGVLEALQLVHQQGEQRLAGVVLIDNSVGEPPAPKPTDFLKRLRTDRAATVDAFVRAMFATPQPEPTIAAIKRSALRMPLDASISLLSYPFPREHWRQIARGITRPLAYLVSPRFAEQARNLAAARPATRIEIFDAAGHALFVDAADRFNAVLADFVEGVERATA